jgi:hypothetical protein
MNYQNSKIYKVMSDLGNKIYIGSTTKQYLSQRMQKHRQDYLTHQQGKRNKTTIFELFEEYGTDNCKIILIENYPCSSRDELNAREGHFISTLECVNKIHLGRSSAQHYQDNKVIICARVKAFYEANKDVINAKDRERGKIHITCECGVSHRKDGKSKHLKTKLHLSNMDKK